MPIENAVIGEIKKRALQISDKIHIQKACPIAKQDTSYNVRNGNCR